MSKNAKLLLGLATFLPLFIGICFVMFALSMAKDILLLPNQDDPKIVAQYILPRVFSMPFILLIFAAFTTRIGLLIYYIMHVVNHKVKTEGEKIMWILLFIFIGTIANIIYFFVKVVPMQPANMETNNLSS